MVLSETGIMNAMTTPRKPSTRQKARVTKSVANKKAFAEGKAEAAKPAKLVPRPGARAHSLEEIGVLIPLILEQLETGSSLYKACRDVPNGPSPHIFQRWLRDSPSLTNLYAQSRLRGYLMFAEELQEIADNPRQGVSTTTVDGPEGRTCKVVEEDMLGHRQLQIATRKWLLCKMVPKVFGDRMAVETNSPETLVETLRELARKLPV